MNSAIKEHLSNNPDKIPEFVAYLQKKYGIPAGTKCTICEESAAAWHFLDAYWCIPCMANIEIE